MEQTPPTNCPICSAPIKYIPAGLSKTKVDEQGNPKPYNEFWACENRECDFIWRKTDKKLTNNIKSNTISQHQQKTILLLTEIRDLLRQINSK